MAIPYFIMAFHMVCIWTCINASYLSSAMIRPCDKYQQSLQKRDHVMSNMQEFQATELKFYKVSTFPSIQERCHGLKTGFP